MSKEGFIMVSFTEMDNKTAWKRMISWMLPLAVGGLGILLSGGIGNYEIANKPPLSPPGWVFPLVWTVLYVLMGEAAFRIYASEADPKQKRKALTAYGVQLALNLLWPIVFFGGQKYLAAFVVIIALWVAIYITVRRFMQIDEGAGDLLVLYFIWVTFAAYLNLGVFLLT
jgi:tryptophan-rich sensory protein